MDVGNSIYFNGDSLDRTYSIRTADAIDNDMNVKRIVYKNMLALTNTNNRESGIVFDAFTPGVDIDAGRLSMYTDIQYDTDTYKPMVKTDHNIFEIAVADNGLYTAVDDASQSDRIIARKYHTDTRIIESNVYQQDSFARVASEMALLDYDGKTKIGANNLVVGDLNVSKILEAVISELHLTRSNFTDTPMYEDYRTKTPLVIDDSGHIVSSYRDLEEEVDAQKESSS